MQKHLAIGRGVKILDQKNRGGGGSTNPFASLRVNHLSPKHTIYDVLLDSPKLSL